MGKEWKVWLGEEKIVNSGISVVRGGEECIVLDIGVESAPGVM